MVVVFEAFLKPSIDIFIENDCILYLHDDKTLCKVVLCYWTLYLYEDKVFGIISTSVFPLAIGKTIKARALLLTSNSNSSFSLDLVTFSLIFDDFLRRLRG